MAWTPRHTNLQRVCIWLWPVPGECRQLVAEAQIDSSRMTFSEPPALFWESVILQCEKQATLRILTPILLARYPDNLELRQAVAPWIDLPETPPREIATPEKEKPKVAETQPTTVVTETPTTVTTTTQVQKIPDTNVAQAADGPLPQDTGTKGETEYVPVTVPKEMAEEATTMLLATIRSLKLTVDEMYKDVSELKNWRLQISTLSRAEVAVSEGGNESGPNHSPLPPKSEA